MSAPSNSTPTPRRPHVEQGSGTGHTSALPALMSVPEAAKFLGLSRASAYRYAEAGLLPTKRFGRRVYVVRARLSDLLESNDGPEAGAA
jgi:excisionase family DNA binding protein